MDGMERIKRAIKEYKSDNGHEYDKILISESFYEQLCKELFAKSSKNPHKTISSAIVDFPGMELIQNVEYDFKLIGKI